jgi:hypothetical protein
MTHPGGTPPRPVWHRWAWGAAIAVAGTAAMIGITIPLTASGDDGPSPASSAHAAHGGAAHDPDAPGRLDTPAAPGDKGTGRDPLTPDEEQRAAQLALGGDQTLRTRSENVAGKQGGPQLLSTDLAEAGGGVDRKAEVYFYDYRDDTLVHKTVDLTSGQVESSETSHGSQPPPSPAEATEAARLLIGSDRGAGLKQDFKAATGHALTGPDQLRVQGLVFTPRPGATGPLASCGAHRCVRLFTRVKDGPWIDTRHFVIDLSDRTVHHA